MLLVCQKLGWQLSVCVCFLLCWISKCTLMCRKNLHARFFLAKFVSCLKVRGQTLPEINLHARLFGTLEYEK